MSARWRTLSPPHVRHSRWIVPALVSPGVLGASVILNDFAQLSVPAHFLVRPILVVSVFGAAIAMASLMVSGRAALSGAVAAICVATVMRIDSGVALAAVLVASAAGLTAVRRGTDVARAFDDVARAILVVPLIMLAIAIGPAIGAISDPSLATRRGDATSGRNIYLLVLDGYPRDDMLADIFGIDNEPFLAQLEDRGFDVYRDAEAHHDQTVLTLATLLAGSPNEIPEVIRNASEMREARKLLTGDAAAVRRFRSAGYQFIVSSPRIGQVTIAADRTLASATLTELEILLLERSTAAHVLRDQTIAWIMADWRKRTSETLAQTAATAGHPGPHVVLGHVLSPHMPFQWDSSGAPIHDVACWPRCSLLSNITVDDFEMTMHDYATKLRWQLVVLNAEIITTVDRIAAADPTAAIAVLGDHGARYSADDVDERRRVLLATRTPGHSRVLEHDPRPGLVLHVLAELYLPPAGRD